MNPPRSALSPRPARAGIRGRTLRTAGFAALAAACLLPAAPRAAPPPPVREITVVSDDNYPPYIFRDADGVLRGILPDQWKLWEARTGVRVRLQAMDWAEAQRVMREKRADVIDTIFRTPEREQLYDFHALPVLHSWSEVYRAPGSSIHSLFDLQGQRVAVLKGSVQGATFLNMMDSFGVQVVLVDVPSYVDAFALVQRGGADAVIANHRFGNFRAAQYGLIDSGIVFQPAMLYFVAERGRNADVLAAIDRAAQGWRAGGDPAYAQVLRRWGGPDSGAPVSSAMGWGMAALGVAALLAGVWVVLLRRKVQERTQ